MVPSTTIRAPPENTSPRAILSRKYAFDAQATAKNPMTGINCRTIASGMKCTCQDVGNTCQNESTPANME